ncbi:SMI1/KNR4 family protein [Streptomyces sp. ICBB 8177]|uniref:SMI1/KNR4 family protein n=1 Tax=Streptomyces sp. ICBB 8177 TaxID=563922 RepID=UPI000D67D604|nr:SMI1/KNR4 family protein [Streptomyces sp. ICBB 8177]PWI42748.1 hypothetical protein CK485_10635 [Streptomyces sp. ICBB 8177]
MTAPVPHDDLLARVADRARRRCPDMPPPVSERALADAERALGFPLHPLLARLYREVGDGGFGPEYRFFRLDGSEPVSETHGPVTLAYRRRREPHAKDPGWFWPEGVVPVMTWGCGMLACVDCRSPEGTVLLFEPNPVDGDWADAWFLDAHGLAQWLETSLSGRGWYAYPGADDSWADPEQALSEEELDSVDLPRWGAEARARAGRGQD